MTCQTCPFFKPCNGANGKGRMLTMARTMRAMTIGVVEEWKWQGRKIRIF